MKPVVLNPIRKNLSRFYRYNTFFYEIQKIHNIKEQLYGYIRNSFIKHNNVYVVVNSFAFTKVKLNANTASILKETYYEEN